MAAFLAGVHESRRLVSGASSSSAASSSATLSHQHQHQHQHQHHQRTTRTPSTCSQVSELDEDELEEEEEESGGARNMSSHTHRSGAYHSFGAATSGGQHPSSTLGAAAAAAVAAQRQQPTVKRCFKQLLQSIPVPLAATSIIITTLILCSLLLSECKSLQLTRSQVAALEMPQAGASDLNVDGLVGSAVASGSDDRLLDREREVLRRELIGELVGFQQQQQQVTNKLAQQQQPQRATNKRTNSQSMEQQQQQQVAPFDTLGALLMGSTSSSPESQEQSQDEQLGVAESQQQSESDERFLDGTPEMELAARPSHMRSSPLAIELPAAAQQFNKQSHQPIQQPPQSQHHQQSHQYQHQHQQRHHHHQQQPPNNNKHRVSMQNNHNVRASAAQEEQQAKQLAYNHERPFDVAQIQCNNTDEGFERFACPTPDMYGRFRCIEDRLFCDGYYDCPGGEDEEPVSCMYYKLFVSHIDILTNTFLTWMKKQNRQSTHRSDVGVA